jgi:hypothetical protein
MLSWHCSCLFGLDILTRIIRPGFTPRRRSFGPGIAAHVCRGNEDICGESYTQARRAALAGAEGGKTTKIVRLGRQRRPECGGSWRTATTCAVTRTPGLWPRQARSLRSVLAGSTLPAMLTMSALRSVIGLPGSGRGDRCPGTASRQTKEERYGAVRPVARRQRNPPG